ncbi:MAG: sensor histidine kinase [Acidobacteriota bacterium]
MSPGRPISPPAAADPSAQPGFHQGLDRDLADRLRTAQAAILARPRLSIRLRLVGSLALCFLLCCAFALATLAISSRVRDDQQLLESLERVRLRAEQATEWHRAGAGRAGLGDAVLRLDEALALLRARAPSLARAGASDDVAELVTRLDGYRLLLLQVEEVAQRSELAYRLPTLQTQAAASEADIGRLEAALAARQRAAVDRMVALSRQALLAFLLALLVVFSLITFFFAGALVGPIRRFQAYTKRIAAGDFTLIAASRAYRDEFSDLALAVNQMLAELQAHQDRCVKAGKLAAVGTITSGIAHELNNPLNNISITTEALMEDLASLSDGEKWQLLQDVYFETERATEIVRSLLDFTRREKPDLVPLDLADVIQSTVRLAQNEMAINNVTYESDLPAGLPRVRGASNQLRQVFLNLFLNAVQAMPKGGTLRVSAASHEEGKVCAEVHDDGVGIPPDILPHVFDPFFTTKEPGQGTGLGLSVSYSIIKKFGGDIQVTSEAGRGTTFHVCLPVASAP